MTIGQLDGRSVAVQDGLACVMLLGYLKQYGDGWCVIETRQWSRWELADSSEMIVKVTDEAEEVRCVLKRDTQGWYLLDARTQFVYRDLDGLMVRALYVAAR